MIGLNYGKRIKIKNDICCDVNFYRCFTNKKMQYLTIPKGEERELEVTHDEFLVKKNIWEDNINKGFIFIYSLDFLFGNMMESDNMPFSIYQQVFGDMDNATMRLSEIITVDKRNLQLWNRVCTFQIIMICALIAIIAFLFSFIFNRVIQMIILVFILALEWHLFKGLIRNKNLAMTWLQGVSQKEMQFHAE